MGTNSKALGIMLFICNLLFSYTALSQNENTISKEMIKYSAKCEFKQELDKIFNKLKPEDQKLIFIVNTSIKNNIYQISLTTSYDVKEEDNWIGFCKYRGKLLLLKSVETKMFFLEIDKSTIQIQVENNKKPNGIVQPYLDNLPYWLLEYKNETFTTKLSAY